MCGIFGGIGIENPRELLNSMAGILSHRGPDDEGSYINKAVALGHRRLSIIDISGGHQPMLSPDKKVAIVFNGEIFNFKEVRESLEKIGCRFTTNSDTEVILLAYREWGYDCLNKFNGMFAFALWDDNKRRLWLVRDRIGVKPLYYSLKNKTLLFASEAKALWCQPGVNADYDYRAIDQYLTFRYVPGDRTLHKDIVKLAPGTWLIVDENAQILELKKWWDFPKKRSELRSERTFNEIIAKFKETFSSAVKLRMISDVPIGLFLSSGIDSASIATEMVRFSDFLSCYTIGLGEQSDEISLVEKIAFTLKANLTTFLMSEDDFDLFPEAVAAMDEPYGDPIILPTYLLAKKAANNVKVVLSGDGADEIVGGYIHHNIFRSFPNMPVPVSRLAASLLNIVPYQLLDTFFQYPASAGKAGKQRLQNLLCHYPDIRRMYLDFATLFTPLDKDNLYIGQFKEILALESDEIESEMSIHFSRTDVSPVDLIIQWEMKTWLPNQTLMKLDRLSMAHSLEGRSPYVDYRLVELFMSMPDQLFRLCMSNKDVIRRTYEQVSCVVSPKKKAFYFPTHGRFDKKFIQLIGDELNRKDINETGLFNFSYIQSLLSQRRKSPLLIDKQLMSIVILLLWIKAKKRMRS